MGKNKAAQELGRLGGLKGGKSTSEAKKKAARENGKKAALKCKGCKTMKPDTGQCPVCFRY